jgi:hypothetical protein
MAIELSSADVIVVGAPSVLSVWGFDLVRIIAAQLASAKICTVDRTDEVEVVPENPDRPRVICLVQYPSGSLVHIIRSAQLPVIAFIDEPIDSVRYMREALGCTFIEALRAQTAAAVVYKELRNNPGATLINRSTGGTAGTVAAQVLGRLSLGLDASAVTRLTEKFSLPLELALRRHVAGYLAPDTLTMTSNEDAAVIGQVLRPMILMATAQKAEPICWPNSVFLFGDQPDKRAPPTAEVTGPARIIFYGPYFHLPAGRWQVRMIISFSDDPLGIPFSVEVHGSALIAKAIIKPNGEGTFQVSFSMTHDKPQDALELRIRNDEAAIEGRISLSQVLLIPEAL